MNLCDSNHDEICFEGRDCPLCSKIEEKDSEIEDLRKDLRRVTEERDDFEQKLYDLESGQPG